MIETPKRRRGVAVVRGLAAFIGLAAILGGVPYGLWLIDGSPLPSSMPSPSEIGDLLTSRDDGSFFVSVLIFIGWIGWASFALAVLVEIPAALRGVRAPRLPAIGTQQRLAAGLVAAVGAMLAIGPTAVAGNAVATEQPSAEQPWQPAPPITTDALDAQPATPAPPASETPAATEAPPAGDAAPAASTYVVQAGDTLWDVSDAQLGDPTRYTEIFEASTSTVQPDGRQLTDPDLIVPGWQLTVPGAASGVVDTGAPPVQPPAEEPPPAEAPGQPPTGEQDGGPGGDGAVEQPGGVEADRQVAGGGGTKAPAAEETAAQSLAQMDPVSDVIQADGYDLASLVRTETGVGALLATGLVGLLVTRRTVQQRRRRAGQRLPEPPVGDVDAEVQLRQVANPLGVEFVDAAMRTLTDRLARDGRPLPPLRAARLLPGQLELYLAQPAEPPEPFEKLADDGAVWLIRSGAGVLSAEEAAELPAPYPSLVTLGHDDEDAHLMVDLEHLGALGVDGDPERVRSFMTAVAAEYATSRWADDIRVTLVGEHVDLERLDTGRVRHVARVEQLLEELAARAERDREQFAAAAADDLAAARVQQKAAATWTPEILLVMTPMPEEVRGQLTALVHELPRVAIAAVTTDLTDAEWTLRFTGDDVAAVLEPVNLTLRPQLLDDDTYAQVLGLVETAAADPVGDPEPEIALIDIPMPPAAEADEAADDVDDDPVDEAADDVMPAEPRREAATLELGSILTRRTPQRAPQATPSIEPEQESSHAAGAGSTEPGTAEGDVAAQVRPLRHQPPRILMLGPVDIENPAGNLAETSKRGQGIEIAVYVSLRPGLDGTAMDDAIWSGKRNNRNTRNTAVSKLRRWLGESPTHEPYLPHMEDSYRLHPEVRSDWQEWQDLLPGELAAATTDQLRAALELVRGMPLSGRGSRKYAWADTHTQEMVSAIVDVSHELAQRHLAAGDLHGAGAAAQRGLDVEPGSEMLWRDRLKVEARLGTRATVDALIDKVRDIADELGGDLEEETTELIEQLSRPSATSAAS